MKTKKEKKSLFETLICNSGSLWIPQEQLRRSAARYRINLSNLPELISQDKVRKLNIEGRVLYTLPHYDMWETYTAFDAVRVLTSYRKPIITDIMLERYIDNGEKKYGIKLHEQQRAAVKCAVMNGICIITGGPGTGKTSVLQLVIYVLRCIQYDIDIRLTSPTGKAARRITESTGRKAKTVQKELGITYSNDCKRMFGGDVLIVDEVSMLDMETAYYLFRSIQNGQKVILCGDIDQLPSVGPGAVLRDFLLSGVIPYVMLTKTFRQDNDSNLFENIQRVRNGEWQLTEGNDFSIIHTGANCMNELISSFISEVNQYGIYNVACLLPYRKEGPICSDIVNNVLQNEINQNSGNTVSSKTEKGIDIIYKIDDPVIQLENREECANGDVGRITDIKKNKIYVQYNDCVVVYTRNDLDELSLAYSMSINKSQGSEYPSVVMAMTTAHLAMLKRNLVYTGITRARKKVSLLQEDEAMMKAISVEDAYSRDTFLAEKLKYYMQKYEISN